MQKNAHLESICPVIRVHEMTEFFKEGFHITVLLCFEKHPSILFKVIFYKDLSQFLQKSAQANKAHCSYRINVE